MLRVRIARQGFASRANNTRALDWHPTGPRTPENPIVLFKQGKGGRKKARHQWHKGAIRCEHFINGSYAPTRIAERAVLSGLRGGVIMHKTSIVLIFLFLFILVACDKVDVSKLSDADMKRIANNLIVCSPPYIRHGSDCCLDKNNNSICDSDETTAPAGTPTTAAAATQPAPSQPITITEYADYQCPFSGRVEATVKELKHQYGNKITLEYKNYPLDRIHPDALNASIAAECARDQGDTQFWAYHDKLFDNQDALNVTSLKQYASDIGLNTGQFDTCLDNKETEPRVRADIQEAEGKGVQGTPSFWIKDELVVGALPIETFEQKIDEKLAGTPATGAPTQLPAQPAAKVDVAEGDYKQGPADAKVVVVEFTDYQCPYCKQFFTATEQQLLDTYVKTGKVRFAVRNFPMSFHQNAQKAAEAAMCAGAQGKFWEMHTTLFTKGNGDGTGLDTPSLKQYAADLQLDTTEFNSCLDNSEMGAAVQQDQVDGDAAGVSGTPSFFVNGRILVGAQPFTTFKTAIDAELTS